MRKLLLATTAATVGLSAAAFAGSPSFEPAPAPAVAAPAPAPVYNTGTDWTGAYAGFQLGYGDADASGGTTATGDGLLYGIHGGYNYDFGSFVLGGELDYNFSDIALSGGAGDIDNIGHAKLRAGYDLGNTLLYVAAGYAQIDTSFGDDNGTFYGVGADYRFNQNWTVGGELLAHQFDDINGTGTDLDLNTLNLKASYNF